MSEYNFEPDYAAWWSKPDLTKEQLIWLMLGVNPEDAEKIYFLKGKEVSHEDEIWRIGFYQYLDTVFEKSRTIHGAHPDLSEQLDWKGEKHLFIKEAYEAHVDFHEPFKDFLLKSKNLIPNQDLEKFKNYEQYKVNFSSLSCDSIDSEEKAFPVLLGLEPKWFLSFLELVEKINQDKSKFLARVDVSAEDKWFYREYGNFFKELYGNYGCVIAEFIKLKRLKLWSDGIDFKDYVQKIYDRGFTIPHEVHEKLTLLGITLKYSENGEAIKFYKNWITKKPLWELKDAARLYLGISPYSNDKFFWGIHTCEIKGAGHCLHDKDTVLFLKDNGDWERVPVGRLKDEISLERFVKDNIDADILTAKSDENGNYKFEPSEIVKFFRDYCPNTPQPLALFQALGIHNEFDEKPLTHSGLAGRPTAKHLYLNEMRARASRGELLDKVTYEARYLHGWMKREHPKINSSTERCIENNIRNEFCLLKSA